MARDRIEEMVGFHTREQARLEAQAKRWVNQFFGRSQGYFEAAYAHGCALRHLAQIQRRRRGQSEPDVWGLSGQVPQPTEMREIP